MVNTRPPGMNDVAKLAGVSHQTVSRVLNGHPSVRPATRERVLEAIASLGYRRNSAARALVTAKSGVIGVITTGSSLFGPQRALIAIEEAAREAGYFVSMATIKRPNARNMSELLGHLVGQAVEGIVVIAPQAEVLDAVLAFPTTVPVVLYSGAQSAGRGVQTVSLDQEQAGRMAVAHLAELGHTRIAHVSGPLDWTDAKERLNGWKAECKARNLQAVPLVQSDWSAERGYEVGIHLVRSGAPTAVFAANDMIALGLIRAFTESGLNVPGDVSVIGVDDMPGASNFLPPLTTIHHHFATLGRRIIESLLTVLDGGEPSHVVLQPDLVVRSSTAQPRSA